MPRGRGHSEDTGRGGFLGAAKALRDNRVPAPGSPGAAGRAGRSRAGVLGQIKGAPNVRERRPRPAGSGCVSPAIIGTGRNIQPGGRRDLPPLPPSPLSHNREEPGKQVATNANVTAQPRPGWVAEEAGCGGTFCVRG